MLEFTTCMSNVYLNNTCVEHRGVGGIVVSIAAFQAVDPGSIPGQRTFLFSFSCFSVLFCFALFCFVFLFRLYIFFYSFFFITQHIYFIKSIYSQN